MRHDAALTSANPSLYGDRVWLCLVVLALITAVNLRGVALFDNYVPHLFALRADRQVHRYGVLVLAGACALLLIGAQGDTQTLVPVFAIGVFIGFTISQAPSSAKAPGRCA